MPVDRPDALPAARRPHRLSGGLPGLLAPGATTDPYRLRLYRLLRTDYPLGYDPALGAWLLSRYADVALALTDPRFTGYPHDGAPRGRAPVPLGLCRGSLVCGPLTVPWSTAAPAVERTAYVLARRIAGRDRADLVADFCRWLPAGAAAAATGLAHQDLSTLPRGARHRRALGGAGDCTGTTALREHALASFLANMLDDPDLLAVATAGEPHGDGSGSLLGRAWAETLRRDPPVQIVLRRTRTEVAVSGGTLPADAPVACLIGAAGRDPARFAAPDRFDPLRSDADPLLIGPAGCPAALLGRLEAEHGLRALLTAMPGIRWADGFRPVAGGLLTRGPRALLVRPS
ncbi:pulcherriminic acid synthase [Streptomyces sp. Ncost-T6T-1]|uniref:cytochrome P450 n=1 Tax=Streptomyces sp. Ncost-T6T-1 TaxID=1100828 RepID=UPI000805FC63|nr:cytochrome P450 [Streptomyces sp. Ncost-T6T-1]SBV05316.1 pulcherriminic acid synthase [Streptomyces sp. Ncost-T6T-1]